jgi:O-antigen/teichoic acid export membrane protein
MNVPTNTAQRFQLVIKSNLVLLLNSSAQALTAFLNAVFGFIFWWVAARYFPTHSVGLASAAISMMNLISLVGELGLGTLLIGHALNHGTRAAGLTSAALFAASVSALLVGAGFLGISWMSALKLGNFFELYYSVLFITGCTITCFSQVLDSAFVGLLRSAVPMYRNVTFAALKLVFLIAAALATPSDGQETIIFLTWVLGQLASILLFAFVLRHRGRSVWRRPDFPLLRPLMRTVLSHHLLNLITQGPTLLLPFIVTVVFSAHVNAAFYASWMMLSAALLVPSALTTTLFTIGSVEPESIAERLKFSLFVCAFASIAASAGCLLLAGPVLSLFGPSYAAVGGPILQILGLAAPAIAIKYHYIAVQRLRGRMAFASLLLGAGGILELAFAIMGSHVGQINGFTSGWVAAAYVEAVFIIPTILRAIHVELPRFGTVLANTLPLG